ncbi:MAG: trypsin-like serine protease [Gammaproteobacteria bacterium]
MFKKLVAVALMAAPLAASATPFNIGSASPAMGGGAAPDSSLAHLDPNLPSSPFSGVVSISVERDGLQLICTGALIGKRTVMSAAHCVDSNGQGQAVDLNNPQVRVKVNFNSNGAQNASIAASSVSMHANYQGFGNCPGGQPGNCLTDDVALINLSEDAPASARVYKLAVTPFARQTVYMAGYGWSGDGVNGFTVPPDFGVKRFGLNYMDGYLLDDELGLTPEAWVADYDGAGIDADCMLFGVCTPVFNDPYESVIGPGDSGGPAFVYVYGELMVAGTTTFGSDPLQVGEGRFGTLFGGMLVAAYTDYLLGAAGSGLTFVPEPDGLLTFALCAGVAAAVGARRRRTHFTA